MPAEQIPAAMVGDIGHLLLELQGKNEIVQDAFDTAAGLARAADWDGWRRYTHLVFDQAADAVSASSPSPLVKSLRWTLSRIRISRGTLVGLAVAVCIAGAWALSRISRSLPATELARLDGLCKASSGLFSGTIYNGSQSWTIRELTVRLTLDERAVPDVEEGAGKTGGASTVPSRLLRSREYQIRNLWIPPLETRGVSVEVLTPSDAEFVQWRTVAAKGFRDFLKGPPTTRDASSTSASGKGPGRFSFSDITPERDASSASASGKDPWKVVSSKPLKEAPSASAEGNGKSLPPGWTFEPPATTGKPSFVSPEEFLRQTSPNAGSREQPGRPKPHITGNYRFTLDQIEHETPVRNTKTPTDPCKHADAGMSGNRPPNGSFDLPTEGHGKLNITNGNAEDAAVILASTTTLTTDRLVYVRADMSAPMTGITTGQYRMMFQIGRVWDDQAEAFRCVSATGVFDSLAVFEEHEKSDGVEYTEISITLHKLVGGNARTSILPKEHFRRRRRSP
jgi:hypothetical protein